MFDVIRIPVLVFALVLAHSAPAGGGAAYTSNSPAAETQATRIDNQTGLDVAIRAIGPSAVEVKAILHESSGAVLPVTFLLGHGQALTFAFPEQPAQVYTFRDGPDRVMATVDRIAFTEVALID